MEAEEPKKVIAFRLVCGIPPIIGAVITNKLSTVLDYTGVIGLLICLIMPAILYERSLRAVVHVWGAPGASKAIPRLPWEAGGRWARVQASIEESDRSIFMSALTWILGGASAIEAVTLAKPIVAGAGALRPAARKPSQTASDPAIELEQPPLDARESLSPALEAADAGGVGSSSVDMVVMALPLASRHPLAAFPQSPYGGWWSNVWCSRIVFVSAFVIGIFVLCGLGGAFGPTTASS